MLTYKAYGILLNNASIGTLTVTSSLQAPSFTATSGGQFIGYHTGAIGANTANSGAFTTLSTTGNATIQGNILVTGNIIPSVSNTYSLGSSTNRFANLWIKGTTIYLGAIAVSDGGGYLQVTDPNTNLQLGIQTASINNTIIGNTGPASGTFTTANVNGTLYAATVNAATIGNSGAVFSGATSTLTGASQAASFTTSGGGQVTGYITGAIGANTANSGNFTTVVTTSNLYAGGNIVAASGTSSTSTTSGALVVQGGIGASGNIYIAGSTYLGTAFNYTPQYAKFQHGDNQNNYVQLVVQNQNSGNQATTDIVAVANNGSDNDTFIDMGINSSGYNQAAYNLTGPNDGYLYITGNTTTGGGNLVISTYTLNDIVFSLAGSATANEFARMRANTNSFVISSTTNSTSTSTGALQVRGGAGVSGNLNVGTASYSPIYYYSNGVNILNAITASAYSNANAASYLPTYNGNIGNLATGNLIPLANTSYYLGNSTNYYANVYANNFNAITQLATPKIQFTVGGASIVEDNSLDLAIVGPYQISIKPASYQYTFNNNGSLSGPGGTFVYANGAIYGNITATGAYWANGVSFASTITGTYSNSNVNSYLPTYTGTLSPSSLTTNSGGQVSGYLTGAIGANSANTGAFTTVTATGALTAQGTITGGGQVVGYFNGAIGANTANSGVFTTVTASGNITAQTANVYGANFVANTASYSPVYYYANGVNILNAVINSAYSNTNAAAYLTTYTGNLLAGNITALNNITGYLNGTIGANAANSAAFTTVSITNGANSYGSGQGALQIGGGFYAGGDSYINGNLQIKGNLTSVGYSQLVANAPLLYLSVGSISTYNYELGFYSHKYDAVEGYNHTGVVRNHLDNSWYFFSNVRTEPDSTVDLGNANTVYDTVKLGNIIAYSGNTSTSTTTGAAVIYGGMGVGGNIYASAIQGTPIGNGVASSGVFTSVTSVGQVTGYHTGAIGANSANSGAFTTLTTTGGVAFNSNATLTTDQATVTLFNLSSTTINFGGAATTISIGANTGRTTINNDAAADNFYATGGGQLVGYLTGAIGANTANTGAFTSVTASGNITAQTANVYAANVIGNTALYGGQYYWTNGVTLASTITGLYGNSNVATYLPTYTGTLSPSSLTTNSGGQVTAYLTGAIGANVANSGVFTTANVNGTLYAATLNAATIGNSGATFNGASINLTGNASINAISAFQVGNTSTILEGTIGSATPSQPNITSLGTLTSLTVSGTAAASSINAGTIGNSGAVFNGASINLTGNASVNAISAFQVGNTSTILEGTIASATPSQPNITSVGTLTSLTTSGNITAQTANVYAAYIVANTGAVATNFFYSNGTSIAATIAAASYSNTNAGAYLTVYNGNIAANYITAVRVGNSGTLLTGTLTTNAQPYITAIGTLTNLTVTNTITGSVSGNAGTATALQTSRNINGVPFNGTSDITVTVDANNLTGTTLASGVTASSLQSVGFLNDLSVNGNINTCNSVITNSVTAGVYTQNISTYDGVGNLNVYVPRNANLTVNAAQVAANLVVHGNSAAGYQNLLVTSGATGQVGIKVAPNAITSGASLEINSTDSIQIPVGTTAQRPTGAAGMIRYNTTNAQFEYFNATTSTWVGAQGAYTTITESSFTGDGSTTTFTLAQNSTTNGTFVSVNGVLQIPTTAYSVSGNVLTFTEAPISTDIIDARVVAATTTVTGISGSTGGSAAVQANSSVYITGGLAAAVNPTTLTQNTPTTIDTFPTSTYRVAKYVIKVSDSTNGVYSGAELIVAHNGTTATSQVYGVVNTGANALATFSSSISGGNVLVTANTWSSTATATVFQTYMPV